MVLKLTGAVIVIINGFLLGNYYGMQIARRLSALRQIYLCMQLLKHEIVYQHATLSEAFSHVKRHSIEQMSDWLSCLLAGIQIRNGTRFDEIWNEALEVLKRDTALTQSDLEVLSEFGSNLGYLNLSLQEERITYYMILLEKRITEIEQILVIRRRLYRTAGILGGCFVVLVLF